MRTARLRWIVNLETFICTLQKSYKSNTDVTDVVEARGIVTDITNSEEKIQNAYVISLHMNVQNNVCLTRTDLRASMAFQLREDVHVLC